MHIGAPARIARLDATDPADDFVTREGNVLADGSVFEVLGQDLAGSSELGKAIGKVIAYHALNFDSRRRGEIGNALETVGHERFGGLKTIAKRLVLLPHGRIGLGSPMNLADRKSSLLLLLNNAVNFFWTHAERGPFLVSIISALAETIAGHPERADAAGDVWMSEAAAKTEAVDEGFHGLLDF
jgi:hypothetical protein